MKLLFLVIFLSSCAHITDSTQIYSNDWNYEYSDHNYKFNSTFKFSKNGEVQITGQCSFFNSKGHQITSINVKTKGNVVLKNNNSFFVNESFSVTQSESTIFACAGKEQDASCKETKKYSCKAGFDLGEYRYDIKNSKLTLIPYMDKIVLKKILNTPNSKDR